MWFREKVQTLSRSLSLSDDKKDSDDITRIEDLSDFIHDENDEDISLEDENSENLMDLEKESFGEATSFMQIPDELDNSSDSIDEIDEVVEDDNSIDDANDEFNPEELEFAQGEDFDNTDFEQNTDFESDDAQIEDDGFEEHDFESNEFDAQDTSLDDNELQEEDLKFGSDEDEIPKEEEIPNTQEDLVEAQNEHAMQSEPTTVESITAPPSNYKEPETLKDINQFAENITSSDLSIEGNPPFSVILKSIKYQEDADEILSLLREFKIIKDDHIEDTKKSLDRGQMLIPRLSEYSAITLCHKLRRFDLDISMGLSQEMHSASSYESIDTGLVSKNTVYSNKKLYKSFNSDEILIEDIQITNMNSFENFTIIENLSVKSKSLFINNEELAPENFDENYSKYQTALADQLKSEAIHLDANALINFNIALIASPTNSQVTNIVATANVVRIRPKE